MKIIYLVPCEERKGKFMCPEDTFCEIQTCKLKPYGKESYSNSKMFILPSPLLTEKRGRGVINSILFAI